MSSAELTAPDLCVHRGVGSVRRPSVNGVAFDPVSVEDLAAAAARFLECGSSHVVHFCAAHPTVLARKDREYREMLNRGDLNVPDGVAVSWALRLFGCPATRLPGSEAMIALCEWGVERKLRHYLFGGTPPVVEHLRSRLESSLPGIHVVGAESPPFRALTDGEWRKASDRIVRAETDLLWIGLGAPKQDFAADRLRDLRSAPVILCVGAAFDFISGARPRAPTWMQRIGFEWLHRLAGDPRRLWRRYLIGNPQFVEGVVRDYVRARFIGSVRSAARQKAGR